MVLIRIRDQEVVEIRASYGVTQEYAGPPVRRAVVPAVNHCHSIIRSGEHCASPVFDIEDAKNHFHCDYFRAYAATLTAILRIRRSKRNAFRNSAPPWLSVNIVS